MMQPVPEDILMPHPAMVAPYDPQICAEMVFFETLGGGAVFTPGSLNWVSALPVDGFDNDTATITGNALRRFLDPTPFVLPGDDPAAIERRPIVGCAVGFCVLKRAPPAALGTVSEFH